MADQKRNKWLAIGLITTLTACNSNVGSDWDCPALKSGYGCINIANADTLALQKLESVSKENSHSHKVRKIWVGPYVDEHGDYHDASIIYFDEEL